MVNQRGFSSRIKEVMLLKMTEESKDISDVDRRATLKGTVWQKMCIYIMRRKWMKMLI